MESLDSSDIQKLEGFRQRLQDINSSGLYITNLSREILFSEKTGLAKFYMEVWSNAIISEKIPSKLIALFYVINDYIQHSHLKSSELVQTTVPYLKNVCESISKVNHSNSTFEECQRVISILRARCVFEDRSVCLTLTKLLQGCDDRELKIEPQQFSSEHEEENPNKKILWILQSDGNNSDGFITPSTRLLCKQDQLCAEDKQFSNEISSYLKEIHDLRKQLVDKVYFERKIDIEINNLLVKHAHLSQIHNLPSSTIELDEIQKALKQNRAKQKVLIQKQWKLREDLHSCLVSFSSTIACRNKTIFNLHYEAHRNFLNLKSIKNS